MVHVMMSTPPFSSSILALVFVLTDTSLILLSSRLVTCFDHWQTKKEMKEVDSSKYFSPVAGLIFSFSFQSSVLCFGSWCRRDSGEWNQTDEERNERSRTLLKENFGMQWRSWFVLIDFCFRICVVRFSVLSLEVSSFSCFRIFVSSSAMFV